MMRICYFLSPFLFCFNQPCLQCRSKDISFGEIALGCACLVQECFCLCSNKKETHGKSHKVLSWHIAKVTFTENRTGAL